jgi:hypothetical protein
LTVPSKAAQDLWDEALRLGDEFSEISDKILTLGLEVIQLLGEQQQTGHSRTREMYSEVMGSHDRFIRQIADLGKEGDLLAEQVAPAKFAERVKEALEKLSHVDVMSIADDELIALCTRAMKTIEGMPDIVGVAVASTAISRFGLAHSHAEVLNAFLDHPPLDQKVIEGVAQLAKAAALDMGGSVFPFLGTLETLFELATPQIKRDAERMRSASAEWDRLFVFGDQLNLLCQGADLAKANARAASQIVSKTNLDFARESRLLITVFEDTAKD